MDPGQCNVAFGNPVGALPIPPPCLPTRAVYRGSRVPTLPAQRVHHLDTPSDNSATVYVKNLPFDVGERELLDLFNSVNDVYSHDSTAVSAVNFPVKADGDGNLRPAGQCFIMYGNRELAEFAVDRLHKLLMYNRRIEVQISRERLSCRKTSGHLLAGQSRMGEDMFLCFS